MPRPLVAAGGAGVRESRHLPAGAAAARRRQGTRLQIYK